MWSTTGVYPLLFLIYINDLNFSIKSSTPSHFADDTCIGHHSNKLKTLETELNCDLKLCNEWLKVNRLSLNVDKSKFILFHSQHKNINYTNFSIKINGIKLNPTEHVKYLCVYMDKHLSWDSS